MFNFQTLTCFSVRWMDINLPLTENKKRYIGFFEERINENENKQSNCWYWQSEISFTSPRLPTSNEGLILDNDLSCFGPNIFKMFLRHFLWKSRLYIILLEPTHQSFFPFPFFLFHIRSPIWFSRCWGEFLE